jgi:5'-nucleotidase
MDRRRFLLQSTKAAGALAFSPSLLAQPEFGRLTILHTNDMHSRIDPFPMNGGRNQGLGGMSKRAALIDSIRAEKEHILLLDSGDIFQGTPYFNFFGGELEFKLMSKMGYDYSTVGNHDFDGGIDGLVKQMPHAKFKFLCSNYDFRNTEMEGHSLAFDIVQKGDFKIGLFGLGIELEGLVPKKLYTETQYLDPIRVAQQTADILKNDHKCDMVICLSHLGYDYGGKKICDVLLAQGTNGIDLILGGHTHTFMQRPDIRRNNKGDEVIINQVGFGGILLGQLDFYLERNKKNKCIRCKNSLIG